MRRRRSSAGFTLLEIMVAIAILSSTLVVLLSIVTNNVRSTNHAKMTTSATLLARTKMVDVEDEILGRERVGIFELVGQTRAAGRLDA